ncbi:hypothetical protein EMCG_03989 [[Emmonsia] crescens]|uniref:DUF7924 domain-containing protein n=1 Tax=[Emmonsia] crescens TaxID=73230 RepID=A0A0G2HTJ5_9EURO|nr:hypothetical protein EMCG_03989 [Emmonsia crescens UAMH 3008]
MTFRRKSHLIDDQAPKSLDKQPERVENQGPSSLRRSLRLFKKRQIAGEVPSATIQSNPHRIEQPSQYSIDRAAKRRRTRSLQPGGSPTTGGCYSNPAPSDTSPRERSCERTFQYERVPQDSPRSTKRQRHIEDSYVEYWLSHRYQVSTAPLIQDPVEYWHARPKTSSLHQTKPNTSLNEPSEISSSTRNKYCDKNFEIFLQTKGSFMDDYSDGVKNESRLLCQELLQNDFITPRDTVFDDSIFSSVCAKLRSKSETGIVRTISELIVPSADIAICRGHVTFKNLVVSIDEAWDNSISLDAASIATEPSLQSQQPLKPPPTLTLKTSQFQLPRPQPDYAVGFSREAFTEEQLSNLTPFVGDVGQTSFFLGTANMFFPFLTSEVTGRAALDIADHQNAHSMTLAVRGIVELFRIVKREKELNGEILGFSISHDYCSVRIYGHYPIIDGDRVTYYRHTLRKFDFTELDGRDRWASYKFTMRVYNDWVPSHFQRLCSAIDMIPHVDFEVSRQAEERSEILQLPEVSERSFSETAGLSRGVEGVDLGSSFTTLEVDDPASRKNAASGNLKSHQASKRKRAVS